MKSLYRYIFQEMLTPFAFATVAVTAIVWLTQSLQRLDMIVEHGQSFIMFGRLTLLLVPSLLSAVIPFALLGAALFALHRLHSDSEIAVMFAAGVSRLQVAGPILLIALIGALATLWINFDLMPRSYRVLKQEIATIRADFATALLRGGEFTTVSDGVTVYVDKARPGGQFTGLLVHDYRNGGNADTYLAHRAILHESQGGAILYLSEGNIQRFNPQTKQLEFLEFSKTAVNISDLKRPTAPPPLELTERYVGELLRPDLKKEYDRRNETRLIAEGHGRIAGPFYAFAYVLFALYALIGGPYDRRGYLLRISLACAAAAGLRVLGFVLQSLAADMKQYWLVYLPIGAAVIGFALLIGPLRAGAVKRDRVQA